MKKLNRQPCPWALVYLLILCLKTEANVFTSCDFEEGFCGWTNSNWSRTRVKSPLENTGPVSAYHGQYYIYSHLREIGHNVTATLESNVIPPSKYCLLFNYHIRGLHVEKLEVKLNNQSTVIWYRDTDQGVDWQCATINVTIVQPDSRIQFISKTGKTENSLYDIIGLDNIKLASDVCNRHDCDSSFNVTSTTTQQPIPSSTTDSLIKVQQPTETETSWFKTNLPYLVGVPGAVFLVSFVVIGAYVFHSHKEKSRSRQLPAGIMRGPHRSDRITERYLDNPTNHQSPETGNGLYYSEPDTYDYVDVVRDPNNMYLDVISDDTYAVPNGSYPADVSPKPLNYYNEEYPYCEPVKSTKDS